MLLSAHAYIADADVLDESRVELGALDDGLEELVEDAVELGVLEAALTGLGEGRTDGEGDDDVVGVLGGAVFSLLAIFVRWLIFLCSVLETHMDEMPPREGVSCLTMELRRSAAMAAIVCVCEGN